MGGLAEHSIHVSHHACCCRLQRQAVIPYVDALHLTDEQKASRQKKLVMRAEDKFPTCVLDITNRCFTTVH